MLHDATRASPHVEQYAECGGNRGFYRDGWKLLTRHSAGSPYSDQEWQLFDVRADPTELDDVAAEHPDKVRELAEAWEKAAWANTVFPLSDTSGSAAQRRPEEVEWEQPLRLLPGTPTLERYRSSKLTAFRSFAVDVELTHRTADAGVLVAHGDQGGGYSIYVEDGHLRLAYNEYGDLKEIDGGPLAPGTRHVCLAAEALPDFRWRLVLSLDGAEVGVLESVAMLLGLSPFEGIDVGIDRRSPVHWGVYERHGAFPYSGRLHAVTYTPGARAPYAPSVVARAARASTRVYE